ncbi:MAG: efflux RND transporter periplasmic adaptor subunit [Pirellulales bacterium]|nr:efflux RND transporter periplasmic adaptor subunit [Pirellulales bacterium]
MTTTNLAQPAPRSRLQRGTLAMLVLVLAAGVAWLGYLGGKWTTSSPRDAVTAGSEHDEHDHGHGHSHAHPGHDEASSIEISKQAQRNIGLELATVDFQTYERTVSLPAIVVERPGRSRISVPAPLTGVITRIDPLLGQAIVSGEPLFEMRLTHEELVQAQSDFLRTLEETDVVKREIARLEDLAASGAIAGKTLLERQYELQRLEATSRAQSQALLLHGLSEDQIENIRRERKLLGSLVIVAPTPAGDAANDAPTCMLQLQELNVELGQHVTAGDPLCVLADHCLLYIEGQAFEQDARLLEKVAKEKRPVRALIDLGGGQSETIPGLDILSLGNRINPETRTLPFHVLLPNELVRDERTADGHRFVGWRFRPGQRVQVLVPIDTWQERIVLPVAAVVQEGPESYVFVQKGDHFDRRPVHVEFRDQQAVVLSSDEENLWPGDIVAINGAQQLQLALKNKAGGGIDPHAGHSH